VKDEEWAEDLTQETFLHAFSHLSTFKEEARFSTWIWRIAHNLCLNHLKKRRVQEEEFVEQAHAAHTSQVEEDGLEGHIRHLLPQLSLEQRQVFEMYDLQRIPQKEIAVRLGIPYGTVRSRLYYARHHLRNLLKQRK